MKKLGFGCMRLPVLDPGDVTTIDMPQFEKMVGSPTLIPPMFTTVSPVKRLYGKHWSSVTPGTASPWLPSCRSLSWGKLRIWTSTLPNSWKTAV